jgi:hypothetical protein
MVTLLRCPLSELLRRSARLARCDAGGSRLPGAPWAFQLASAGATVAAPTIKTVGFQRVSADGIDFLVRRRGPSSPAGGRGGSDGGGGGGGGGGGDSSSSSSSSSSSFAASFCYCEGAYPPAEDAECVQWRGEGEAMEIPVTEVRDTAPLPSFAQIMACSARGHGGGGSGDEAGRTALLDRERFVGEVRDMKAQLLAGGGVGAEVETAVQAFRLRPHRVELLVSGADIWERFEWQRQRRPSGGGEHEHGAWGEVRRLLPY